LSDSQEFDVHTINIWNHKNRNQPQTAVFIKNRPKPTANLKMATVTALPNTNPNSNPTTKHSSFYM